MKPSNILHRNLQPILLIIFMLKKNIKSQPLPDLPLSQVIDGLQHASSVSYHHKKQLLVWADAVNDKIFSVKFSDTGNTSLINEIVGYGKDPCFGNSQTSSYHSTPKLMVIFRFYTFWDIQSNSKDYYI